MSRSNSPRYARVSSRRTLNDQDIKKIATDLNNGKETELIKNKLVFSFWTSEAKLQPTMPCDDSKRETLINSINTLVNFKLN